MSNWHSQVFAQRFLPSLYHTNPILIPEERPFASLNRGYSITQYHSMCQLLGMNSAAPTDFSFSFRGFCRRGGHTDIHSHGWGLAIYEGKGLRTFNEPRPAAESPVAQLVSLYPIKTYNMMAHIRYATQGAVTLENVHPFRREMVSKSPKCDSLNFTVNHA